MSADKRTRCETCGVDFDSYRAVRVHEAKHNGDPWESKEKLQTEYVENGKSAEQLGDEWECDPSTVTNWLKKHGITVRDNSDYTQGYASYTFTNGYERWREYAGEDRYKSVSVHRLAAVAWFGLDAVVGKHVHHENGVKWDNREANLSVLEPSEHARQHRKELVEHIEPEKVKEMYANGQLQREIAEEFGVAPSYISRLLSSEGGK